MKGYIACWELPKSPESKTLYRFNNHLANAASWATREQAEDASAVFNRGIEIPSEEGGVFVCRDFKVEQRTSDEFVVFCEAPFAVAETSGQG
jgi:hypothetical protein